MRRLLFAPAFALALAASAATTTTLGPAVWTLDASSTQLPDQAACVAAAEAVGAGAHTCRSALPVTVTNVYGPAPDAGQTDDAAAYAGPMYFVDCAAGDDTRDGRTPATAWRTLDKVNTKTAVGYWDTQKPNASTVPQYHEPWTAAPSGSAFLFKRGTICAGSIMVHAATFVGSVTVYSDNITFGAYGDRAQARPVIKYAVWARAKPQVFWTNGHTVSILNLAFVGNTAAGGGGLEVSNAPGVRILNTMIEQAALDGVHADNTNDLRIENSTISSTSLSGGRGGGLTGSGSGWRVLQSRFVNNGRDKVGAHNIYARHLHNAEFKGNSIEGGSNLGIVIHGSSDHVTIAGNDIFGNSNGIDITGGYSEYEVFDAVAVEDNLIRGNGFRLNDQGYGLLFKSMRNSLIRGNKVTGNRLGPAAIADRNTGDEATSNVTYAGNVFSGAGAVGFTGAAFSAMVLTGNTLSAPIKWGSTTPQAAFTITP